MTNARAIISNGEKNSDYLEDGKTWTVRSNGSEVGSIESFYDQDSVIGPYFLSVYSVFDRHGDLIEDFFTKDYRNSRAALSAAKNYARTILPPAAE